MKDIARDLGVSVVTVSKVLRNHSDIGTDTRERVLQRVRELNYRPNLTAQSLVTGKTYLVGLIVPDLVNPFFAEVAKALSNALRHQGYCLIVSSSEEDSDFEKREIDQLLSRSLDALVIASANPDPSHLRTIQDQQTPFVLIDREFQGFEANFIGVDDRQVGYLATRHLIDAGCTRIAHMRGPGNSPGLHRLEGYRTALQERGFPVLEKLVVSSHRVDADSWQSGFSAMKTLLEQDPRPDGVFCFNDPLAVAAIDCILASGLRVPEDIAIIGCGNLHYNASLRIALSSVDQQSALIGQRTAELLLNLIHAKSAAPPQTILLDAAVVARRSSQRSKESQA